MAEVLAGRHREVYSESRVGIATMLARFVYWLFSVIEILIGLRFLLELFAANPAAPFVQFVYRLSAGLMAPFYAVFPTQRIQGSVFDWSALLAMAVYALVAWAIVALIYAVTPREGTTVVEEHDVDDV